MDNNSGLNGNRPIIGITMGDPAGIGPEIALKALKSSMLYGVSKPVIIGDESVLRKASDFLSEDFSLNIIKEPDQGKYTHGTIDVISLNNVDSERLQYGVVEAEAGRAAYEYIIRATELAVSGKITAIATTPINKESIKAANIGFTGHTEMFGGLTGTKDPLTLFQVHSLRIFFLSRHVSLRKACDMVTRERLADYIERCDAALKMLGVSCGTLAVAGLNPHNGEHGLFGDEEGIEVEPAVRAAREKGIDVTGPVPADSVFSQALNGKYSAVLSLYHDQGHIAAKTLDFEKTVSLTIGMPFLRTSVNHGTAFDIAGKGTAGSVSMEEAIRLAAEYGPLYRQF